MCVFCTSYIGDVQCSYIFSDYILICVGVCVREGESSAPVKLTAQEIRAIKITISVNIKTDLADPTFNDLFIDILPGQMCEEQHMEHMWQILLDCRHFGAQRYFIARR